MKKGNVLLLSLFLIAFAVSIIGLIYSYNKRILLIAKQERDNYYKTNLLMKEVFTNLYILDKFKDGFTIRGVGIDSFSSRIDSISSEVVSINFNWVGNWEQTTSTITPKDLIINERKGVTILNVTTNATPEYSSMDGSQNISGYINATRLKRYNYFDEKRQFIKDALKNYISNLYQGFEHEIQLIGEIKPAINEDTSSGTYTLEYEVTVYQTKKGKKKINKKFKIIAEYDVSISFIMKSSLPNASQSIQQSGIADTRQIYDPEKKRYITEYKYYFNKTFSFVINTIGLRTIELRKFEIKQI